MKIYVALLLSMLFSVPAVAQKATDASRARPVTVILRERFNRDAIGAVVQRSAGPNGRDLIAIRRDDLSPELLETLLRSLTDSRKADGTVPTAMLTERYPHGMKTLPISAPRRRVLQNHIEHLKARDPAPLAGIGTVQFMTMAALP